MKLTDCSLQPLVDYYALARPISWSGVFGRKAPLVVEIGFGMGEVIRRNAKNHPDIHYVGIEQHWERFYKTMKAAGREETPLRNIRFLAVDARVALQRLFGEKTIDHIYCLFPCPWPKKSHVKNRLFSRAFLELLNSRLKPKGQIYFVTDFYPYYQWVLEQVNRKNFDVKTSSIQPQFDTKFERKWVGEGQQEFFELVLTKKKHIQQKPDRDRIMKSYTLKEFSPQAFSFEDIKEDISIIFKDKLYDPALKKCLLRFVVSEEHLTQNFWVTVVWKKDKWRICRTEGQKFFPTTGIIRTLEEVYSQARSLPQTV